MGSSPSIASVSSSRTLKANNLNRSQPALNDSEVSIAPRTPSREMSISRRPTLVRRMTSGTLGNDDSIHFDGDHHRQSKQEGLDWTYSNNLHSIERRSTGSAPPSGNNTSRPPYVKKLSRCESDVDTFETSSVSSMEDIQVRKLPGTAAARSKNDPESLKIQEIFATLTEEDKETAARTSWKYFCDYEANNNLPPMKVDLRRRDALAKAMISRHLAGESGNVDNALEQIHVTLHGRREEMLDWVRCSWHPDPEHWTPQQEEFSDMVRTKMSRWLGPHGRVCLLDYDEEDRCNFYHKLAIWTEGTRYDREAILYAASYMMEKAIACTERRSQGRQSRVNVVLDFRDANMRNKNQTLPISIALEVVELMKDHHPDRLWTITMIDAPFLARLAWPIFRPFVSHIVQGGVKFVTGSRQILKAFGPKMLHYDRASNLDMDKFFQLPFDQAYEDVHGHALEY